ncbi:hypothetical protein FACS189440_12940 [Bacteroidia bacterium]|nr:hypothetical protein FACS189440_12940 [Bacteroidia bacterium]
MVFYSQQSQKDFVRIFKGLINWKTKYNQPRMTYAEVVEYRNDIYRQCLSIDNVIFHHKTTYKDHKKFGQYVFSYKRTSRTIWYIIYDIEGNNNDVFIKKIINNYLTIE